MKQSNKIFKFTVTIHTALRTYITIYKSQQKLFYKKHTIFWTSDDSNYHRTHVKTILSFKFRSDRRKFLQLLLLLYCTLFHPHRLRTFMNEDFVNVFILFIFCWISLQRFYFSAKCSFDAKKYCYIYIFGTEETTSLFLHRTICK